MWLAGALVIGSLFAVVAGDTLFEEGQVRLSATQHAVAAAVIVEKAGQVAVAQKASPPVVVSQAEGQGLVAPTQVVYLPHVPLDVPLPPPNTAPVTPSRTAAPRVPASR